MNASFDLEEKRGGWGVTSVDVQQVHLLDVAEAFAWAGFDVISRLKYMQSKEEENEVGT